MRNLPQLCTLFFILLLFWTVTDAAEEMVVSGNPESPPVVWEKSGQLAGAGPEIAAKIFSELGVPYTMQPAGTWQQVQNKAKTGEVDLILSAYKNKERQQYLEYSIPYIKSPVVIIVKKGDTFLCNCWEDMVGKKGVANTGESFGDEFDAYIKNKLDVTYTSYSRAFEMLAEDTADYLIIDLYPAIIYSKLLMAEDNIEFMEKPVTVQYLHMAMAKQSPHLKLLPQINKQLAKMKESGDIKKLAVEQYKKWNKTFQQRQRFYAKAKQKSSEAQVDFDAGARDRGLDNMARFIQREAPFMDGSNF